MAILRRPLATRTNKLISRNPNSASQRNSRNPARPAGRKPRLSFFQRLGLVARPPEGMLANVPKSKNPGAPERLMKELEDYWRARVQEATGEAHLKFDPENIEHVGELLSYGISSGNKPMIEKAILAVVKWNPVKARKLFENFFEAEDSAVQNAGMQLYMEYLRLGGKPLGGSFARLDAEFFGHA